MSRQVGASLSTIERAVRKLVTAGHIEQTRRAVNRGPNPSPAHYRLTILTGHVLVPGKDPLLDACDERAVLTVSRWLNGRPSAR